jgi:hypothetical protein
MKFAAISAASSGSNEIVAAVAGKRIKVLAYTVISAGSVSMTWRSASTAISGAMPLAANGGAAPSGGSVSPLGNMPLLQTEVGEALNINLSSAVGVYGHLTYVLGD